MAESYPQVKPQRQPPHFTVDVAGYRATNAAAERLHSGVGNNNYTALRQSFLGTTTSTPMFRHNGQTVGRICKSIYRRRRTARAAGRPIASTGPRRRSGRALGQARLAAPRSGRYMRHYASTQALLPDRNTIPSRQPQLLHEIKHDSTTASGCSPFAMATTFGSFRDLNCQVCMVKK